MPAGRPPLVVKTSRKEIVLAVAAIILVTALLLWGFIALNRSVPKNNLEGTITAKHFTPKPPSTEITLGQGGLSTRHDDGDYTLDIHVPSNGHDYILTVDKTFWDTKKVGDDIIFLRPPEQTGE